MGKRDIKGIGHFCLSVCGKKCRNFLPELTRNLRLFIIAYGWRKIPFFQQYLSNWDASLCGMGIILHHLAWQVLSWNNFLSVHVQSTTGDYLAPAWHQLCLKIIYKPSVINHKMKKEPIGILNLKLYLSSYLLEDWYHVQGH